MKYLDIEKWNRKQHFNHFKNLADPTFGIVADVDVSKCYQSAKENKQSFFVRYLHACMMAINAIENFKYRIEDDKIAIYETINASATIARLDNTFGFSYIGFSNILLDGGLLPTISTDASLVNGIYRICAGTLVNFNANEGGVGYIYHWDLGGAAAPNTYIGSQYEYLNNIAFNMRDILGQAKKRSFSILKNENEFNNLKNTLTTIGIK
mgnify:CR=1 FL=1